MFKIRDKVVCKKLPLYNRPVEFDTLKVDQIYIVQEIFTCKCGKQFIKIGCAVKSNLSSKWVCGTCDKLIHKDYLNEWYSSHLFEKIQEKRNVVRIQIEEYSYSEN